MIDIAADRRQRLLGHRQRQQIGKIVAAADAPGDMLGDKRRFDTLGDLLDTIEVRNVETVCAPQREPNAVQRYRKITANDLKTAYRLSTAHIIFGVYFHKGHVRRPIQHGLMVLKAQTDPGFGRDRISGCSRREHHCRVRMP